MSRILELNIIIPFKFSSLGSLTFHCKIFLRKILCVRIYANLGIHCSSPLLQDTSERSLFPAAQNAILMIPFPMTPTAIRRAVGAPSFICNCNFFQEGIKHMQPWSWIISLKCHQLINNFLRKGYIFRCILLTPNPSPLWWCLWSQMLRLRAGILQ